MKIRIFKAGVLTIGLFLSGITLTHAQSGSPNPAWSTSKDVQRVANPQLFKDEDLKKSHIRVTSVSPTWNISKGIHRKKGDARAKGNVASKEYPTWIISKGVQRIGRK